MNPWHPAETQSAAERRGGKGGGEGGGEGGGVEVEILRLALTSVVEEEVARRARGSVSVRGSSVSVRSRLARALHL
jgi:hypothetical protein